MNQHTDHWLNNGIALANFEPRLAWPGYRPSPEKPMPTMEDQMLLLVAEWEAALRSNPEALRVHTESTKYELAIREAYFFRDLVERADPSLAKRVTAVIVELKYREQMLIRAAEEECAIDRRIYAAEDGIRRVCTELFFGERAFNIDMSAYRVRAEQIDEDKLTASSLKLLRRYINPARKLEDAYRLVKTALVNDYAYGIAPSVPTREQVAAAFELAVIEIYRRADAYFYKQFGDPGKQGVAA